MNLNRLPKMDLYISVIW